MRPSAPPWPTPPRKKNMPGLRVERGLCRREGGREAGQEGNLICCAGTPPKRSSFVLSPAHMLRKRDASLPMKVSPPACASSRARVRPNSCARASARSRARSRARSLAARSCHGHVMPSIAQYNKNAEQARGQQRLPAAQQRCLQEVWPPPYLRNGVPIPALLSPSPCLLPCCAATLHRT